jgi:hypothetical protein
VEAAQNYTRGARGHKDQRGKIGKRSKRGKRDERSKREERGKKGKLPHFDHPCSPDIEPQSEVHPKCVHNLISRGVLFLSS